jgi:hypothetical protein
MTAPLVIRRPAAVLLAAALGLAALPGCGNPAPPSAKDEKKDGPKTDAPPSPTPSAPDATPPKPPDGPPKNTLKPVDDAAEKAATAFLRDVVQGTVKADALSAAFLKAVGKPVTLPSEKAKGYSEDGATGWLRRVGEGVNFSPIHKQDQVGDDVVHFRGSITGPRLGKDAGKSGGYCLRLLKEGGAWKADWLSLSSVDSGPVAAGAPSAEGTCQAFAVAAFAETVGDLNGMPADDRAAVIAAAMTPALRASLAPPFTQDKDRGCDYNPDILRTEAVKIGGGTSAFTATRVGDQPEYKVEFTKPAGKKTFVVKLVKGAAPHEWLVGAVTEVPEAKG